ncbi:U3 small nucleolar RNA-associated protein 6 [Colletotrichum spaethianum]|uniref:U3 small nucleolar RNA-associated protein 6 n=1 Tax=Colletotrichum spaethianum TaxID=700344 RepID=A0AA37LDC0_9PEZI|nr:U3 small nucleolar RNA-associated protein 6 [Colletotrichum spaethianum]GKT44298.1 U3 small nucleolar RNA-associated protein 6 [Colletotrichum spaethianum]
MSSRRRSSGKFAAPVVKSTPKASKTTIDESRAAVSATDSLQAVMKGNNEAIEISSDEDSEEDVSDEEMEAPEAGDAKETVNGKEDTAAENPTQPKADAEGAEDEEEAGSPTFGELLRGTIDVPAILSQQGDSSKAVVSQSSRKNLAPPSLSSLSTVLTQALKTEDTDLLESCLQITHLETIQQTIERLDSSLAGILLTKLAARFHRRPGRAGSLMTWVKWTLVAHGGALAVQPKVLERLVSLQKVLSERSRGLPSLLALKGKLDMLEAQMQLRKGRQRRGGANQFDDAEDDEEEGAIYVEGEEDGEEDANMANGLGSRKALLADDDDDEVPATNGFIGDSDDEDDDEDVAAAEDESSGEEVVDEDEVDHDDVEDSDDDDDSDAEAAPPAKVQKTASSFTKRK